MNKKFGLSVGGLTLFFVPYIAFAQMDTETLLEMIFAYIAAIIPFLVSAAILFFLWGVLKYVASGDEEDKRSEGRHMMVNGIIAIFVMVSIWGLVALLTETFLLDSDDYIDPPELNDIYWGG